jgi:CBS domain-containing protein
MDIESILASKGRNVSTIKPDATVAEALRRMRHERISALVVSADGERIEGIVSDRGLLHALVDRGVEAMNDRIATAMTKEVFTCSRQDRVSTIMAAMTNRRIRHFPVVEPDGRLCGLVSIGDVVKHHLDEVRHEAEAMREYISGTR